MPFEADGELARRNRIEVLPSAVLELTWVLHLLEGGQDVDGLLGGGRRLREELAATFDDGYESLPDMSVLAERIGALLSDEADTFLNGIERAAQLDGVGLDLRSESEAVREATVARLRRLRADPA